MSTKRILSVALIAALFVAVFVAIVILSSYLGADDGEVTLPTVSQTADTSTTADPTPPDRVEVNADTIQAVVATLSRPGTYSRAIIVESFWADGSVTHNIAVAVDQGVTSLRMHPPASAEKRIIVTPDTLYIWYDGDFAPYVGDAGSPGDALRAADEWQMLVTYEDVLALDPGDIIEAGYVDYGGEDCVYAVHRSPLLGYTTRYYVSLELGLVVGAEEHDRYGSLVYSMLSDECAVGVADPSAFLLPNGTSVLPAPAGDTEADEGAE
jgi:hypothetical protein